MDIRQIEANATLAETAETIRKMIVAARSTTHPLQLTAAAVAALTAALNNLHAAQRELEQTLVKAN